MKKRVVIAFALVTAGGLLLLVLYLAMFGRPYRSASNSMLPVASRDALIFCVSDVGSGLAYGDLVIYRGARGGAQGSIMLKMVVGLSNDIVEMKGGRLWINGKIVPRRRAGDFQLPGSHGKKVAMYEETLPGGVKTRVLDVDPHGPLDNTAVLAVPAGHVFVIGSNRDNSTDSRMTKVHGPVPMTDIICKAEIW